MTIINSWWSSPVFVGHLAGVFPYSALTSGLVPPWLLHPQFLESHSSHCTGPTNTTQVDTKICLVLVRWLSDTELKSSHHNCVCSVVSYYQTFSYSSQFSRKLLSTLLQGPALSVPLPLHPKPLLCQETTLPIWQAWSFARDCTASLNHLYPLPWEPLHPHPSPSILSRVWG
jgi:hypothetical protein